MSSGISNSGHPSKFLISNFEHHSNPEFLWCYKRIKGLIIWRKSFRFAEILLSWLTFIKISLRLHEKLILCRLDRILLTGDISPIYPEYPDKAGPMNSISLSGILTVQWNVKPRWPPIEGSFVRQFQSRTRSCTSVLVCHATFTLSWTVPWKVLFENTHKIFLQKTEMSLRTWNIFRQSQTELQVIFSPKQIYKLTRHLIKRFRKIALANYWVFVLFLLLVYHLQTIWYTS